MPDSTQVTRNDILREVINCYAEAQLALMNVSTFEADLIAISTPEQMHNYFIAKGGLVDLVKAVLLTKPFNAQNSARDYELLQALLKSLRDKANEPT